MARRVPVAALSSRPATGALLNWIQRPFDLLVFDLDGTLIDSELDLALAVNATRANVGLAHRRAPNHRFLCRQRRLEPAGKRGRGHVDLPEFFDRCSPGWIAGTAIAVVLEQSGGHRGPPLQSRRILLVLRNLRDIPLAKSATSNRQVGAGVAEPIPRFSGTRSTAAARSLAILSPEESRLGKAGALRHIPRGHLFQNLTPWFR